TPSRADSDLLINAPATSPPVGVVAQVLGDPNIDSEELTAWELGIRSQPNPDVFWDAAVFINSYDELQDFNGSLPPAFPVINRSVALNQSDGIDTWGGELATTLQLTPDWQVRTAYTFFRGQLRADGATVGAIEDTSRNILYMQSSWDLPYEMEFDLIPRYADRHLNGTPAYFEMDARWGAHLSDAIEVFVVGRNLLDGQHLEFTENFNGVLNVVHEVRRGVHAGVTMRY
ncbi:MAG: TonB-dependent receptor, partial [Planctomycetales bacterium]